MTKAFWDDAFDNMGHVKGSAGLPEFWAKRAAEYRDALPSESLKVDIAYADRARQKLDIVWPDGPAQGLVVFIHGGFWMRLDESYWTDLAEGVRANGWAVCFPSYTLAPEARISDMTAEMGLAINLAAAQVEGPIVLAGHSAGGHLVSRMLCDDSPLKPSILERVQRCVSISGLHDLRPLRHTTMNDTLHLDAEEAARESAVLHTPCSAVPLICWVGGAERPEFIRQAQVMAMMWAGLDTPTRACLDPGHDHFTILEGLKSPESDITKTLLGLAQNGDTL